MRRFINKLPAALVIGAASVDLIIAPGVASGFGESVLTIAGMVGFVFGAVNLLGI